MKPAVLYNELIEITKSLGITLRKEKGRFRGGHCIVHSEKLLIINKLSPQESINAVILRYLAGFSTIGTVYIKPAIQELIDKEKEYLEKEAQYDPILIDTPTEPTVEQ